MSRANVSAKFFLEGLKGALDSATDAELAFAFDDAFHYRYVRLKAGRVEIGQTGAFAGDTDKSKTSKKAPIPAKGLVDVKVVALSDGQVNVYVKKTKAAAYPTKPAATYKFKGTSPGFIGYRALGAKTLFDDFAATVRAFVQ